MYGVLVFSQALNARKYDNFLLCAATLEPFDPFVLRNTLLDYGYTDANAIDMLLQGDATDSRNDVIDYVFSKLKLPEDLAFADMVGITLYHHTALHRSLGIAKSVFTELEANPNVTDSCFGLTPMHLALLNKDPFNILDLFANNGGDLKLVENIGVWTPTYMFVIAASQLVIGGREFDIPSRIKYLLKYLDAFLRSCRWTYLSNLNRSDLQELIEIKQLGAFKDAETSSTDIGSMVAPAFIEMGHQTAAALNSGSELSSNVPPQNAVNLADLRLDNS
jgi:hypothetical protein